MTPSRTVLTTGAIAASAALVLSGCGSGASGAESGELSVVTSTNVYADIVSQIAGDFAEVTAVIDDPNQDPHSYEATTQDRLKLSKAGILVEAGGRNDEGTTMRRRAAGAGIEINNSVTSWGLPWSDDLGNGQHDQDFGGGDKHNNGDDDVYSGGREHVDDG